MNILIINFEYPPLGGGGGVATQHLAIALAKNHTVHVLTSAFPGLPQDVDNHGVKVHRCRVLGRKQMPTASILSMASFVISSLVVGWRLCRAHSFAVINAQFVLPSGLSAAVLAHMWRVPFVLSFIGGDIYDPTKGISPHRHWWLRSTIRALAAHATVCTAISEDTKKRARQLHGVKQEIIVTHIGYVPLLVPPASRTELGLPEHVLIATSIGRLIPRKGFDLLLAAWTEIPVAHLVIIGEGPEAAALKAQAAQLGLRARVHFMGYVSEERKRQMLRASDLYVSSARHEGFGIVFLEAMDAGLPIVAPVDGGQADFLTEGKNALLASPQDLVALGTAISRLLNNPLLRRHMAKQNRVLVKRFAIERTAQKFEQVLNNARLAT